MRLENVQYLKLKAGKYKLFKAFFLFVLLFSSVAFAQRPDFRASQTRGCAPLTVSFTGIPNGCTTFLYEFTTIIGFSSIPGVDMVLTYSTPGFYTVSFSGSCGGAGKYALNPITIQVLTVTKPNFSVSACSGYQVNLNISDSKYDFYHINWGDASAIQISSGNNTSTNHTYPDDNLRTITVSGIYQYTVAGLASPQQCGADSVITITPLASLAEPDITLLRVHNLSSNAGTASLSFDAIPNVAYTLEEHLDILTTNYQTIAGMMNTASAQQNLTFNISGLNTMGKQYCYKVKAVDNCTSPSVDLRSDDICTVTLSGVANASGNQLNWDNYPAIAYAYNLSVNESAIPSAQSINSLTLTYLDTDVSCKQNYCYSLETIFSKSVSSITPTASSISAPFCINSLKYTKLSAPTRFHASYKSTNDLQLSWNSTVSSGLTYKVFGISSVTSSDTVLISKTNSTTYLPSTSYACYAVKIDDQCASSDLVQSCPIKLTGQADNLVQNSLRWTDYFNGDNLPISNYQMDVFDANGKLKSSNTMGTNNSYIDTPIDTANQVTTYQVRAILADKVIYSNKMGVKQSLRVFVPTAFTPNGDGNNDIFYPKGLFFDKLEMKIYNRFGQLVFASNEVNVGWDGGSFNPDLYHYYIRVEDLFGQEIIKKGTVYLIR
jgi:gliding motility-associated-like protein